MPPPFRLLRHTPNFDFVARRRIAFAISLALLVATFATLALRGLNLGLDFTGGVVIEAASPQPIALAPLRQRLNGLGLGEVQLQNFGSPREVLIRVQPSGEGREQAAAAAVREALGDSLELRRVEAVGPAVSSELLRDGVLATLLAVAGIAVYVAFRFEWQFGVSALLSTAHDVLITIGLFSAFGIEFNMPAIACLLTVAGYSINDTVVVFDRLRENLQKRKQASLRELINLSVNETLGRTIMTSATTGLAVLAFLLFGGPALRNFAAGMLFGLLIGTYSSIYVAASLLLHLPPVRQAAMRAKPAVRRRRRAR